MKLGSSSSLVDLSIFQVSGLDANGFGHHNKSTFIFRLAASESTIMKRETTEPLTSPLQHSSGAAPSRTSAMLWDFFFFRVESGIEVLRFLFQTICPFLCLTLP
jgi:hypothetical protein